MMLNFWLIDEKMNHSDTFTAIKFWNVLQVFVGGLLFIMIFLLTKKAIQEIKEEKSMNKNKQKIYTISYSPKGQQRNKNASGSVNSLDSNVSSNLSTVSYLSRGKYVSQIPLKQVPFGINLQYGNTGYGVSSPGIQN